jgi:hypothetical protein
MGCSTSKSSKEETKGFGHEFMDERSVHQAGNDLKLIRDCYFNNKEDVKVLLPDNFAQRLEAQTTGTVDRQEVDELKNLLDDAMFSLETSKSSKKSDITQSENDRSLKASGSAYGITLQQEHDEVVPELNNDNDPEFDTPQGKLEPPPQPATETDTKETILATFMKSHRKSKKEAALSQMSKRNLFKREATRKKDLGFRMKSKSVKDSNATTSSLTPLELSMHTGDYSTDMISIPESFSPIAESDGSLSPKGVTPRQGLFGKGAMSAHSLSDDEADPLYHREMIEHTFELPYKASEGLGLLLISKDVSVGSAEIIRLVVKGQRTSPDGTPGAAARAGVLVDDVIDLVNGEPVTTMQEIAALLKANKQKNVTLVVYRHRQS